MLAKLLSLSILMLVLSGFVITTEHRAVEETVSSPASGEVTVYYFHFSRRCATCMAVEEVTEKSLKELYPTKLGDGSVVFLSVNLDEPSNKPLADQLKVSGQTLLIVKGEKQVDITNQAFMYARTKPEKLKTEIETAFKQL